MSFRGLATTAALVAIAGPAMAGTFGVAPGAGPNVAVSYRDGLAALESRKPGTTVLVVVPNSVIDEKSRPTFVLGLANQSGQPITLLPSSVEVLTQEGRPLRIYTKDELVAAVSRSANGRAKFVSVLAAFGSAGAGTSTATSYTSGTIAPVGAFGSNFNATTTTEYRDPAAAAAAQAQARRTIAQARARASAEIDAAARAGFRAQTVENGADYVTPLTLEPLPKGTTSLEIKVTVGGEFHVVPLSITRR